MSNTKKSTRPLQLKKQTLRRLNDDDLTSIQGGVAKLPTTQDECGKTAYGVCPQ